MDPIFTEEQLNRMSREDMLSLVKIMQDHYQKQGVALQKQKDTLQKQETRIQLLEEKTKELEFLNAMPLGPSDPCPEKTVWRFQRKIRGRIYPDESF